MGRSSRREEGPRQPAPQYICNAVQGAYLSRKTKLVFTITKTRESIRRKLVSIAETPQAHEMERASAQV
eukprot:3789873-Pleurochrysis_carterae.AAC.1